MPVYQAIVLGIVQGLAEFLPISSSAHLILVPWVLGWDDPGLAFGGVPFHLARRFEALGKRGHRKARHDLRHRRFGFALSIRGFWMTVAGAIFLRAGAGLHCRFARNNKTVANRAGFCRRFLAAPCGFCRRSFVPFSIQHK